MWTIIYDSILWPVIRCGFRTAELDFVSKSAQAVSVTAAGIAADAYKRLRMTATASQHPCSLATALFQHSHWCWPLHTPIPLTPLQLPPTHSTPSLLTHPHQHLPLYLASTPSTRDFLHNSTGCLDQPLPLCPASMPSTHCLLRNSTDCLDQMELPNSIP